MNYCSHCGNSVSLRVPEGDNLCRHVCIDCGTIHYENPKIIVGCVPEYDGRILLCRRAIEPRHGYWTIPAGFMENAESLARGAARECLEEAGAAVEIGSLLAIVNVIHAHQVHVMFRARMADATFAAGAESLEVDLVREENIPWSEIAFPSVEFALRRYLEDRAHARDGHHFIDFDQRYERRTAPT
ncbi:MAG: NUDIX hydrolase [Pseudomonadota bacterium]|jgi:8-oxo-dGTP pyrophosphatase MutT (NUDIX family)